MSSLIKHRHLCEHTKMASSSRIQHLEMLERESCPGMRRIAEQIIVENQRGIALFGYPFFSNKLLIPKVDPLQFHTEKDQQPISTVTSSYCGNTNNKLLLPLNFLCSRSVTEEKGGTALFGCIGERDDEFAWFVLMDYQGKYDIDDQGWCYSWSFRSKCWKGKNGFVRKRFWVRLPTQNEELGFCGHPREAWRNSDTVTSFNKGGATINAKHLSYQWNNDI